MKFISSKATPLLLGFVILSVPFAASAQTVSNVTSLFTYALNILNGYVVPIIFAIAFIMFLWGVYRYFIQGGASEEKVQEGQKFVLWSIIGFVIMFSIWGIINLFINTLGFNTSAQPAFPTFNGGTSSASGSLTCLFGGCSTSSTPNGSNAVGSTYTAPDGTVYTYTGANTVAQVNGNCPPNFSPSGNQCTNNASTGSGTVASGGTCSGDGDCQGDLACIKSAGNTTGTCQTDPSLEGSGYGTGNGTVTAGGTCKTNDDCAGNLACSDNDVCVTDGSLEGPGYGDGDGTVQQGGACMDANDCAGNLTCTNGICAVDSQLDAGNGSQGAACTNDNQCGPNLQCQNSMCEPDNGLEQQNGQCTQDSDCQGNLACINGSCQVDPNLDSTDNYVDPNQTQDQTDNSNSDNSGN